MLSNVRANISGVILNFASRNRGGQYYYYYGEYSASRKSVREA